MQRLSQRLFAAIAAVLGLGGMASAQYGQPNPYPAIPLPPIPQAQQYPYQPVPYQPVPYQPVPYQPVQQQYYQPVQQYPYQPIQPVQAAPATQLPAAPATPGVTVQASIGCSTCNNSGFASVPTPSTYLPQRSTLGAGFAPVPYNEYCKDCANGCGSWKSNLGFMFGSCKSFFNPCGPMPCNGICNKCPIFPLGKPYGAGYNTCVYDSAMNH